MVEGIDQIYKQLLNPQLVATGEDDLAIDPLWEVNITNLR